MSKETIKIKSEKGKILSKRGGSRPGAGRKQGKIKKFPFYCALKESLLDKYGSIEKLREHIIKMLDEDGK